MKFLLGVLLLFISVAGAAGEPSLPKVERGDQIKSESATTSAPALFADPALEAAVRAAIGIPSAPLLHSDLIGRGFTTLDAVNRGITNLSGLAQCTDLTWLRLGQNDIINIGELAGLPNLRRLFLGGNRISDLSPLSGLSRLTHLEFWDNEIASLSPIASLVQLQTLNVSNNPVADLSPLAGLTKVRAFYGHGALISNIASLAGMPALVHLGLIDNQIHDLSPLAGLTRLSTLELSDNQIADLSPLANLNALRVLTAAHNNLSDVGPISDLPRLSSLWLDGNQISEIASLEGNPALGHGDTISLDENPLSQSALCFSVPLLRARGATLRASGECIADSDGDGLNDYEETQIGTDPFRADTDGDGLADGDELDRGIDPLRADTDNDGVPDGAEVDGGTDPADADSLLSNVYVDGVTGSDTTGFGSKARPWATVAHAADAVRGSASNTISIHVAKGVYTKLHPVRGALRPGSHERLYGGYDAASWTRDVAANPTILDAARAWEGNPAHNVVVLEGIVGATLDGFIVTGANSRGTTLANSAGILCKDLDTTTSVRNCLIADNAANKLGSGGILLVDSDVTLSACTVVGNYTDGMGGGIGVTGNSQPLIDGCTITGNQGAGGGGLGLRQGVDALITNCVISRNGLTGTSNDLPWGGGMLVHAGTGTIVNCTVADNVSARRGGGIAVRSTLVLNVVNTVFSGNRNSAIADLWEGAVTRLAYCLFDGNPEGDYYRQNNNAPIAHMGAEAINANVAEAIGNVDGDPRYLMEPGGVWTAAPTYNPSSIRTTLTNSAAGYIPGALRGRLVVLSSDGMLLAPVLDNTATSVEVLGAYSAEVRSGDAYQLIDYRVDLGSAAIDAGADTGAPEDGAILADIHGIPRGVDGDGLGAVTGDGSEYDIGASESDAPSAFLTVLTPNGGESIARGATVGITWASSGDIGANVKIVARKGTTRSVLSGSTPDDGSHSWKIPATYPTGPGVFIEVSSVLEPAIVDSSDASLTVLASSPPADTIRVLAPNGGETYRRGTPVNITWSSTGSVGASVKIVASKGTYRGVLAGATANDGSFTWNIPATYTLGPGMTIEISSTSNPLVLDISDAAFTVSP